MHVFVFATKKNIILFVIKIRSYMSYSERKGQGGRGREVGVGGTEESETIFFGGGVAALCTYPY